MRLLPVGRGLRTLVQRLAIPDPAFASIAGQFEILRKFERVDGTGVLAEAAEHAAAQVVGEVGEFLAAGGVLAGPGEHAKILPAGPPPHAAPTPHALPPIS